MSGASSIEWTDATWNPVRGCSRVSEGCRNCYAERHAARFSDEGVEMNDVDGHMHGALPFAGFAKNTPAGPRWTGEVALILSALDWPLRKRKPLRIFVNSMSDLFHEALPDEAIDRVFAVMALAPIHTFQILTKRPERMRDYLSHSDVGLRWLSRLNVAPERILDRCCYQEADAERWTRDGLPNVWLGTSVENQATADERIPHLLATPAEKRFVSYEPALGPVNFDRWAWSVVPGFHRNNPDGRIASARGPVTREKLDWIIVGGESGPGARPFDIAWARSTVEQCKAAGVACFVKQLGAKPRGLGADLRLQRVSDHPVARLDLFDLDLRDRKGGDWSEWPEDLRVREFPQ